LAWLALPIVLLRLALPWLAEPGLNLLLEPRGLEARLGDLDLGLLGGRLSLRDLSVRERSPHATRAGRLADPADELLRLHLLELDLDLSALFGGRLRAHQVQLDGLDLALARDPAGAWNFERSLGAAAAGEPAPPPDAKVEAADEAGERSGPIELALPFEVTFLRVQRVAVDLRDELQNPPLEERLRFELNVDDLGSRRRPARVEVLLSARDGLDRLRCDLRGTSAGAEADLSGEFDLARLDLARYAAWLTPLGIEASAARPLSGRGRFSAEVRAARADLSECRAALSIGPLELFAGDQPVLGLGSAEAQIAALFGPRLEIQRAALGDLLARAELDPAGRPSFAGLVFVPAPGGAGQPAQASMPAPAPSRVAPSAGRTLALGELSIGAGTIELLDRSWAEPRRLALELVGASLTSVELPGRGGPSPFALELASPGLFESLRVQGALDLGPHPGAELELELQGFAPQAAAPYLAAAGLRSTWRAGELRLRLSAESRADGAGPQRTGLRLAELEWIDRAEDGADPVQRLRLGELAVEGLSAGSDGALDVAALRLDGLALEARRDAAGALAVLGFEQSNEPAPPRAAPLAAAPAASAPAAGRPAQEPPGITIQSIEVGAVELAFDDQASPGAPRLATAPLALTGRGLTLFGGRPCAGEIAFELGLAGLFERLSVVASLQPPSAGQGLGLSGRFDLSGLDYAALRPLLAEAGVQPEQAPAALAGEFGAALWGLGERLAVEARLAGLQWRSGERTAAALGELTWSGARFGSEELSLGRLRVADGRLEIERDAQGGLHLLGLHLLPPEAAQSTPAADGAAAAGPAAATPAPSTPVASAPADGPAGAPPLRLERFELDGLRLDWRDRALPAPVDLGLELSAWLQGFSSRPEDPPASFDLGLSLAPDAGRLSLAGNLASAGGSVALDAFLDGRGLELAPLSGYLPEGVLSEWQRGRLQGRLSARLTPEAAGQRLSAAVERFELSPSDGEPVALAFESLSLAALARSGGEAPGVEGLELALSGVELAARRSTDGALHLLGLALAPPARSADAPAGAESGALPSGPGAPPQAAEPSATSSTPLAPEAATPPETAVADQASPASSPQARAPTEAAPPPARARRAIPVVQLERFDLELARLEFLDESASEPAPLALRLRLSTPRPLRLLDPLPERIEAFELTLDGRLEPGLERLGFTLRAEPFELDPWAEFQFGFDGLHAGELARLAPAWFEGLDPSALSDASFGFKARAELDLPRREILDFDVSSGLSANLRVDGLALRGEPAGPALVGLERLEVEGLRYLPANGDLSMRSVELTRPAGRVRVLPEGLQVAGLTLLAEAKPAAAASAPESAPSAEIPPAGEAPPAAEAGAPLPTAAAEPAPAQRRGDISVGQFLVSGLDFEFEDRTGERPLTLPFNQLEVDVRGLSTRALREALPLRFNFFLGAGEVELRRHQRASSLLAGVVGAAGRAVAGSKDEAQYELRPLMQEISAVGRVTLYPAPEGLVRLDVAGLELPAFYGLAQRAGVEIDDGVLDLKLRTRLEGQEGLKVETRATFTDLSLSEPADGPIARYLKLPAPLDSVIFLLKDEGGELSLPASFSSGRDGLSASTLASTAVATLGQVIASAVASSPLRVAGTVTGLFGLGGADEPKPIEVRTLEFPAGWAELDAEQRLELAQIARRLRADKRLRAVFTHEFGSGDWQRAAQLANPSREQAEALARQLRQRRDALEQRREALASEARAATLLGLFSESEEARERLLALDLERQTAELALDRLYALLRPGAEARAEARTREAALAVAESRLEALYAEMLAEGVPRPDERLEFRPPRASAEGGEIGRVRIELRPTK
jgi:hypothetical protein